ncbi:MAG: ATP-binding protein [Anaerolineae bacterium]
MKQLVILSGKGGTGKTTVAAALADLASREAPIVIVDADVDAANLELVLSPTKLEEHDFTSGQVAMIVTQACSACGRCAEVCRFDAVISADGIYQVDRLACEGCAACFYQCPTDAIHMQEQLAGQWYHSQTRFGPLFHAHLFAGQENSGKLVTQVRQRARLWALDTMARFLFIDGPPGIGCPVIAASTGTDLALLVTEPSVSGLHDLQRIQSTTAHFGIPSLVLINKADLNLRQAKEIESFCASHALEVVGRIPFDTVVTEAMVQGQPVTAYAHCAVTAELQRVWQRIKGHLE